MARKYICADCGREIPDDDHDFIFDVDKAGAMCMRHLRCPDGPAAANDNSENMSEHTSDDTSEKAEETHNGNSQLQR